LLLSTGGKHDSTIMIWDISWTHPYLRGQLRQKQHSNLIRRLDGDHSGVTAVMPVLDGCTIVSGGYDGKISVWNVLKNKMLG